MSFRTIALQAILLLVNLLAMSLLSSRSTAVWYGASIAGLSVVMLLLSLSWTAPGHRLRLLLAGAWPAIIVVAPVLVGASRHGGVLWAPHWRAGIAHKDLDTVLTIVIGSTTAFATIYLSSLVDASYIKPFVGGRYRGDARMPCQSSMDARWKGLTARWFMHRLLATLGFVLGLTVVVTITVKHWVVPNENQTTAAGIAAAATLLAGFYLTRTRAVIAFASNPALHVGDAVSLVDEGTQHIRRYYVQDVALEGIKLLELTDEDTTRKVHDSTWPGHDRMLDLPDVLEVLRARDRFAPCGNCTARCKRVNPSCRFRPEIEATLGMRVNAPVVATRGPRRWLGVGLILVGGRLSSPRVGTREERSD